MDRAISMICGVRPTFMKSTLGCTSKQKQSGLTILSLTLNIFEISEMLEPPYYIHYSETRLMMHGMVTSKYFDLAISAVIGLNVITMAMEFYMMPRVRSLSYQYLKIHV